MYIPEEGYTSVGYSALSDPLTQLPRRAIRNFIFDDNLAICHRRILGLVTELKLAKSVSNLTYTREIGRHFDILNSVFLNFNRVPPNIMFVVAMVQTTRDRIDLTRRAWGHVDTSWTLVLPRGSAGRSDFRRPV